MNGITDSHHQDRISTALHPKGDIRIGKDPNIPKETGTIKDKLDLNFREEIMTGGMTGGAILPSREGIPGHNTETQDIKAGNLLSVLEEIPRGSTTSKEWPKRFHLRDMHNLMIEGLQKGQEISIKEMEKITARTAEGRFTEIPQAVCFADGAGKPMTEEHLNMNLNAGNIPRIRIHDIKEKLQDEDHLRIGNSGLRTG